MSVRQRLGLSILLTALICAASGCVTSKKYRLAAPDTPAAQPLGLTANSQTLEVDLATVVVFKGPGSWKKEARWDEYGVVLVNHDQQAIVIESAELIDVLGQPYSPGEDPWKLEKLSRTNWDRYGKSGLYLVAGVGAAALYGSAVATTAATVGLGATAATGAAAVVGIIPVFGLFEISGVAVLNHSNKVAVQDEFQRRRMSLPLTLSPGQAAVGSLFFPMTPGPRRLIVHGRDGERPLDVTLELAPLANLHLKAAR